MAFGSWSRTLDHFPKSFKALKMVNKWASGSLSLCLVLLGFFSANPAFAGSPPSKWAAEGSGSFIYPSYQAACSASFAALTVSPLWQSEGSPVYTVESVMSVYCSQPGFWMNGSYKIQQDKAARVTGKCENGSPPSGSDINNACPQLPTPTPTPTPVDCPVGQMDAHASLGDQTFFSSAEPLGCYNGCQFSARICSPDSGSNLMWFNSATGNVESTKTCGAWSGTGQKCTPGPNDIPGPTPVPTVAPTPVGSPTPKPSPSPKPTPPGCPTGMCQGQVNGQNVCAKCTNPDETVTVDNKSVTTTNPDGTTTKTDTKTTTKCTALSCTTETVTTTTNKDVSGNTTSTDVTGTKTDDSKRSYCDKNPSDQACKPKGLCEENPSLTVCMDGSWSGSTCESPPSCSGDPIQCAQANQAFNTFCQAKKLNDAISGEASELPGAKGIVDSAISQGLGNSSLITDIDSVSVGSFDQTNPWGSTCPADRTIAAFEGHNIEFKLSEYCSIFQLMGTLAVAFTLLAAGLFVFKD